MRTFAAMGRSSRLRIERSVAFEIALVLAICAGVLGAALLILTGLAAATIVVLVAVAYVVGFVVVLTTAT